MTNTRFSWRSGGFSTTGIKRATSQLSLRRIIDNSVKTAILRTRAIMKLGEGSAIGQAGTATVSRFIRGARRIRSII